MSMVQECRSAGAAIGPNGRNGALTPKEVCALLKCSKSWLYSAAGRAVVGDGFKLGRSRRYAYSTILAVLS